MHESQRAGPEIAELPRPAEGTAELCDGFVVIRRFRAEDAQKLFEAIRESERELCLWMVWCRPGYARADCVEFVSTCDRDWHDRKRYSFAILGQDDRRLLGSIGFSGIDRVHKVANLGYWIRTSGTRKGAASAAVRLAVRFALEKLDFQRIEVVVPIGNLPSLRVAEKAGAVFEGVMKNKVLLDGKSHDAAMYAFVRERIFSQATAPPAEGR